MRRAYRQASGSQAPFGATEENADLGFGECDLIALFRLLRVDVVSNNRDGHIAVLIDLNIVDPEWRRVYAFR
ncbi:MAG: hypothetical protein E5W15_02910 [Mesorhizobium sp.]|nr:MAG: hypothetical protein E5W15_02910 [Mesorhizobium sp.]